jgi:hypothetical protein
VQERLWRLGLAASADSRFSYGTPHVAYLIAKLKRDHPDITKRLAKGEFRLGNSGELLPV